MNYTTVKNPEWANAEHTLIDCEVDFDDLKEEFVPFTASKYDVESHSIEMFNRAVNGDFGEIIEYVAPPEPTTEQLLETIRLERDQRLTECDWTQLPDSPLEASKKAEWAAYRQALRNFPATCDPKNPVWPVKPI